MGVDDTLGTFAISMLRESTRTRLILWTGSGSHNAILDVGAGEALAVSDAVKRVGWNVRTKKLKEMKRGDLVSVSSDTSPLSQSKGALNGVGGIVVNSLVGGTSHF